MLIIEVVSNKPLTPEQSRIRSLQLSVDNSRDALKLERDRQKQQRKREQIQRLMRPNQ
jgi:hypothetical protein